MIEDCAEDVEVVRILLTRTDVECRLEVADCLGDGIDRLARGNIDVVLLDLGLPDSHGLETYFAVQAASLDVPVVALSGLFDRALAMEAVRLGAQDYLVKGEITGPLVVRSMQFAIERMRQSQRLVEASREAGMAEVATGMLHNVGNVLNSVNVAANCMSDRLRGSRITGLMKANELLVQHSDDLAMFLTEDEKGKLLPGYLNKLTSQLLSERDDLSKELTELTENIEHIKEIVAMQQSFGRMSGVEQALNPVDLFEEAIKINFAGLQRHGVDLSSEFECDLPRITTDKHKVLQILVNLISNAKYAVSGSKIKDKQVTVRAEHHNGSIVMEVIDNGVGISSENLSKIFAHGFTTKKDGHGFGLHISALAARELGGSMSVHSDGLGKGARFSLTIPVAKKQPVEKAEKASAYGLPCSRAASTIS